MGQGLLVLLGKIDQGKAQQATKGDGGEGLQGKAVHGVVWCGCVPSYSRDGKGQPVGGGGRTVTLLKVTVQSRWTKSLD